MAQEELSDAQAFQLIDDMMQHGGSQQATPPAPSGGDELVEQLRGPQDSDSSALRADDLPGDEQAGDQSDDDAHGEPDVLEKLRRAQKQYGAASRKIGEQNDQLEAKDRELAELRARLDAIESGQQQGQQQGQGQSRRLLSNDQVNAIMSQFDPSWGDEDGAGEYVTRAEAARMAATLALEAVQHAQREIHGITRGVEDMRFNSRLERLGIGREEFDAIWEQPQYSWGKDLTNENRLRALEAQAGTSGSRPSAQGPRNAAPPAGAPSTSRVADPRRMIETSQGAASAHNPQRLSTLQMDRALEADDMKAADKAAEDLFSRFVGR